MRRLLVVAVCLAWMAAACGGSAKDKATSTSTAPATTTTIDVFAASSLTEVFTEIGKQFEQANPDLEVRFTFGGSSALAQQLLDGAPADVFASADPADLAKVVGPDRGKGSRAVFARNRLSIIVGPGNPQGVHGLADLAKPGLDVVLCAPEVPCGSLAAAALAKAGVTVRPKSLEPNVKAVVAKVTLGEADAGIVYQTDVKAAGAKAAGVAVDNADDPALQAVYAMLPTNNSTHPTEGRRWVIHVRSEAAQAVLARYGFLPPT
jgi:molybdate transport system substrate-binding protein